MVEQQGFDGTLQQVGYIIEAADVRQFVSQHSFEFLGAEIDQCAGGNQNHGANPADYRGDLSESGLA